MYRLIILMVITLATVSANKKTRYIIVQRGDMHDGDV